MVSRHISKSLSINFPKQLITFTPSGSNSNPSSSTSSMVPQTPSPTNNDKDSTIKTIASKAVITCMNSTIKNALIDALINRPLVNVNGSIRIRSYICKSYRDRYNWLYQQNREWVNKQVKATDQQELIVYLPY